MERILETIDIKRALHQRFFVRYALRAAMAGIIICLMYIFAYGTSNFMYFTVELYYDKVSWGDTMKI